jgi:FkbM family methyltransferase
MWLLVTGTGRCGTGYIAQLLNSTDVRCSHEGVFTTKGWEHALEGIRQRRVNPSWDWPAESSWLATPFLQKPELYPLTIVHLTRHPKKVIDSHLRLMLYKKCAGPYYQWMNQHIPGINEWDRPEDKAALWYLSLNRLCERRADIKHRIEDDDTVLLDNLGIDYRDKNLFSQKNYNARYGYGPSNIQFDDISQPLRDQLIAMSIKYGYSDVAWQPKTVEAVWIDGLMVPIDENAAFIGGSWQIRDEQNRPGAYDLPLLQFFSNQVRKVENPVILDVGASTGSFSILPLVTGGRVIAFEPNPTAYRALKTTVKVNGLSEYVETRQAAIGGTGEKTVILKVPQRALHHAVSTVGEPRRDDLDWQEIEVDLVAIDDLNLDRVDFIKVDTEGSELEVLIGAQKTIRKFKPAILTEYTSLNTRQCGYERERIMELLKSWGYTQFRQVGIEDLWCQP